MKLFRWIYWWWTGVCLQCGAYPVLRGRVAAKGGDWLLMRKYDWVCSAECGWQKELK